MKKAHCSIALLLYCSIVAVILISTLSPQVAYAQNLPQPWKKISGRCAIDGVATLQGFECIFTNIVRVLVPLAGLALFIMLVVGSFQLITAGGDAKQVQKARATLTSAIAGFAAFFGIWFILLLIRAITGVDVTQFVIPGGL